MILIVKEVLPQLGTDLTEDISHVKERCSSVWGFGALGWLQAAAVAEKGGC